MGNFEPLCGNFSQEYPPRNSKFKKCVAQHGSEENDTCKLKETACSK